MNSIKELQALVDKFDNGLSGYKSRQSSYNELSCRSEFIDPLLTILGWDVGNTKGVKPQYREVIAEYPSSETDRPDYALTVGGVSKLYVEAKKPAVDIVNDDRPAFQVRRYGWNAKHKVAVLTNFEYLIIYDTTIIPDVSDNSQTARFKVYNYKEYCEKNDEIYSLISREQVYNGKFDDFFSESTYVKEAHKQEVDDIFLSQINDWRVALSNELYIKDKKYQSLEVLNDVVQEFINQIIFLRICEDKDLPLYHRLEETIEDDATLKNKLNEMLKNADVRYNSGLFSGDYIIFDLNSKTIVDIISKLYYPQSPYLFSIIEANILGQIYEMFLVEQLIMLDDGTVGLGKKKDYNDRSVVTTPIEVVKYMVEETLFEICIDKSPSDILHLKIADIACGSGIFLEEVFEVLQRYCIEWYQSNDIGHLEEIVNGSHKLPFEEKRQLLEACIYGIDIDIHAVEVAKFSLLIKLIQDETEPSIRDTIPVLPGLKNNIWHGNSLISDSELNGISVSTEDLMDIVPFNWGSAGLDSMLDVIIGNPPYVKTEEMHALLNPVEFNAYKTKYASSYKQFDKYFIFVEQAIKMIKEGGFVCYIIPNKFFKINAGEKLRELISEKKFLIKLTDFGDTQLFADKTIYSAIVMMQRCEQLKFEYESVKELNDLLVGNHIERIELFATSINKKPWRLTTDSDLINILEPLDKNSVPLETHASIFNGIQTSAERPAPVYWFAESEIVGETKNTYVIHKEGQEHTIEKSILRPYYKPTKKNEKGQNTYSILHTDKKIIFPYSDDGELIQIDELKNNYPHTYNYLLAYYDRLVPKQVSSAGTRDVPNSTSSTWYQYGRTQALTSFINTPKLIVGILSKNPTYIYDNEDILIASGGTAGYCAISKKDDSPYSLEYIQAWLTNPITEKLIRISGSDFEHGFVSRGTFVLNDVPFLELDFSNKEQKSIYDSVVTKTKDIYRINTSLNDVSTKKEESILSRQKATLISEVESLIEKVYRQNF